MTDYYETRAFWEEKITTEYKTESGFKILTKEEVEACRSSAYEYIM